MIDAVQAEWVKLRTLPSTAWLLIAGVGVTIAASAIVTAAGHSNRGSQADPTKLSLTGVDVGQLVIAVLTVLAMSEEYGTGMIRTTLAAMPQRVNLLAAKAATLAGLTVPVGLAATAGCLIVGRLLLPDAGLNPAHGYTLISLDHGPTVRAAIGTVLYLILIGLLALGVATILRDTAVSIGAVIGLLYLPPIAAQLIQDPAWRRHLQQLSPMPAGLAIQATTHLHSRPIAPWAGLGVLAAWVVASLLTGGLLLRLRDA
jgi:ABC-2 type transport system permease protein